MGLNWKYMWASFFGGAAAFCFVGAVFGSSVAVTMLFIFILLTALMIVWGFYDRPKNSQGRRFERTY